VSTVVPARAPASPVRRALHELVLVAALFIAYKLGRLAITGRVSEALGNARALWDLERRLRLPSEAAVQHAVVAHEALGRLANSYYAFVHFPATAACLIWLFARHPRHYGWARNTLAGLTAAAFAVHLAFPLAPPRMLTAVGMLDTGAQYGPSVYGDPTADTLSNQYAAMPSLHVGWALVVAVALIAAGRGRWRWLWLAHPLVTAIVVVVTGNHYWLDIIVAVALLAGVLLLVPYPRVARHARAAVPRPRNPAAGGQDGTGSRAGLRRKSATSPAGIGRPK
jgi:PAP2 superfamily